MLFLIFVETVIHLFQDFSKEEHFLKMINLCNIINVFTATFDQFNASLMNKRITFFQKKEKNSPQIFKCLEQNEEQRMCISA